MIRSILNIILFGIRYSWMMTWSNLILIWDILHPNRRLDSKIICYPMSAKTDWEIFFLTTLITLTPGTISILALPEKGWLWIHAMHVQDEADWIQKLKQELEEPLLEILR